MDQRKRENNEKRRKTTTEGKTQNLMNNCSIKNLKINKKKNNFNITGIFDFFLFEQQ